jgi:hypothetical protein
MLTSLPDELVAYVPETKVPVIGMFSCSSVLDCVLSAEVKGLKKEFAILIS